MNVNTWTQLLHAGKELLRGEQVRLLGGNGGAIWVDFLDGRLGCLYLDAAGNPVLLTPAAPGPLPNTLKLERKKEATL